MKSITTLISIVLITFLIIGCSPQREHIQNLDQRLESFLNTGNPITIDGKPFSGIVFQEFSTGQIKMELHVTNGIPSGPSLEYHENGYARTKGTFKDGKRDGTYESFHDNGRLMELGTYKDGKRDGYYEWYNSEGQLYMSIVYKDGERVSSQENLNDDLDSISYSFGYLQGRSLFNEGIETIDIKNYVDGFNDALNDDESVIDEGTMQILIQNFFGELQSRQRERQSSESDINIGQGKSFLEENSMNSDVFETNSGLQYRILKEGTGARPSATDEVQVHYKGSLLSNEVFDNSYERGSPMVFPLNRVIPGWTEGLQLMTVGSKYQFFIPAELAYGNNPPSGSIIPPGAVLIFEVELLDIR